MAKKSNTNAPGDSASLEWASFLSLVPAEDRKKMAEDLFDSEILTYADYVRYCQKVQFYLLRGHLSPQMSAELRAWASESYNALTALAMNASGHDRHLVQVVEAAKAARQIEVAPPDMDADLEAQLADFRKRQKTKEKA